MPYIEKWKRSEIEHLAAMRGEMPTLFNVGELTYVLYKTCLDYLEAHDDNYATRALIVGALEQAKDEFQRRKVHPYEDQKIKENGDV